MTPRELAGRRHDILSSPATFFFFFAACDDLCSWFFLLRCKIARLEAGQRVTVAVSRGLWGGQVGRFASPTSPNRRA